VEGFETASAAARQLFDWPVTQRTAMAFPHSLPMTALDKNLSTATGRNFLIAKANSFQLIQSHLKAGPYL
jgi:hypothetical protein